MNKGKFKKALKKDFEGRRCVYLMGEMRVDHYRGLKEMYEAALKLLEKEGDGHE